MNAHRSSRGQTLPALVVALGVIAAVGVAFAMLVYRPAAPSSQAGSPSTPPVVATPKPSSPAVPSPSAPAPSPSAKPGVDLESSSGHRVRADLIDQTDTLVSAVSGTPGDGMSVRWHDSIVKQHGANAIEITWVALPQDDQIGLGIHDLEGPLTVVIVQAGPVPYSDAMGEDRVVVLTFDHPVDADDVVVEVLDRTID